MMFTSFILLLLIALFQGSQGGGFDRCGTDDRCDLIGANLDGNNIVLPKGKEYIETSAKDNCACQCKTWGPECKAWTWIIHSKRCYLKTRAARPQFGAAFASYISGQKECQCVTDANNCIESGLRYDTVPGGADILDKILVTSAIGCSCACHRLRNCLVWTFNKNVVKNGKSECTLLARATTRVQEAGFDSAVVNCEYVSRPSVCTSGWTKFKDSCYKYNRELKSWEEALSACRADSVGGADLVSLQSEDENKFVSGLPDNISELGSTTYGYWTGGIWKDDKGSWSDGSEFKFTNWKKGEPNNKKPAAISFVKGRADWNDEKFDAKFPFICEYKLSAGEDRAAGNRTLQNNTNMAGYAPAEEEKNLAKE